MKRSIGFKKYFVGVKKSLVLKSETEVLKLKKSNKKKPLLRKSKLGESFTKFRDNNLTSQCSTSDPKLRGENVFGRKFSFSLENFNSLTLQDNTQSKEEDLKVNFSSESFKQINVSKQQVRIGFDNIQCDSIFMLEKDV